MLTSGTGISKLRLHSRLVIVKRTEVYCELLFFQFRLVLSTKMLKKLSSIPKVLGKYLARFSVFFVFFSFAR